jgi:hypothetical protein
VSGSRSRRSRRRRPPPPASAGTARPAATPPPASLSSGASPRAEGRRWATWALLLAALLGAWIGRQATALPESGTRAFDIAIAVGIAAIVALGYRRLALRYRRLRRERARRR